MASVDALTLVNRVRRRSQLPTVSAFDAHRSDLVLDLVNESKNAVLEERVWPFDLRHDGVLVTSPAQSEDTNAWVPNGSTSGSIAGGSSLLSDVTGDLVTRIAITDSSDYGSTAFRLVSAETSGSDLNFILETPWPGTTGTVGTRAYQTFSAEYLLPETVRSVLSVRSQEEEIRLAWIDPSLDFPQVIPRPLDEISDDLRWVGVGGFAEGTFDASSQSSADERKMRMIVYPVPDSALVLHYSYVHRHPDLTSASDTLDDVPSGIVDEIVHDAYARLQMSDAGNDTEAGLRNLSVAKRSRRDKARNDRFDPFRRRAIRPVDGARGLSIRDRLSSPFGESEL